VDAVLKQAEQAVAEAKAAPAEPAATPEGITLTAGPKEAHAAGGRQGHRGERQGRAGPPTRCATSLPGGRGDDPRIHQEDDVTDANLVFSYVPTRSSQIASFSDSALKNVKTKDLGEVGEHDRRAGHRAQGLHHRRKGRRLLRLLQAHCRQAHHAKNRYD
jgi:hypothetical protein